MVVEQAPTIIIGGALLVAVAFWIRINASSDRTRTGQVKGYEERIASLRAERAELEDKLSSARRAQYAAEEDAAVSRAQSAGLAQTVQDLTERIAELGQKITRLEAEIRQMREEAVSDGQSS
jgi:chromosome segregation ATPase